MVAETTIGNHQIGLSCSITPAICIYSVPRDPSAVMGAVAFSLLDHACVKNSVLTRSSLLR